MRKLLHDLRWSLFSALMDIATLVCPEPERHRLASRIWLVVEDDRMERIARRERALARGERDPDS